MRYVIRPVLLKEEVLPSLRPPKKRSWRLVKAKNGEGFVDVKVDNVIADHLAENGFWLEVFEGYPWVFAPPKPCSWCKEPATCGHFRKPKKVCTLHGYIYAELKGLILNHAKTGERQVIHHKNENKFDARLKNLVVLTRSRHAALHNAKSRKFTPRHRHNFGPFRFQPRLPSKLKTVENDESLRALVGQKRPARPKKPKTTGQRIFAAEEVLKSVFDSLVDTVKRLGIDDMGEPIPRGASTKQWRSSRSRVLGIHMPRMACDEAEAAFVLLYVLYDFDLEKVATDIEESPELLGTFLKRVPVSVAIDRWVKHRRLPDVVLNRGWEEVRPQPTTKPKK